MNKKASWWSWNRNTSIPHSYNQWGWFCLLMVKSVKLAKVIYRGNEELLNIYKCEISCLPMLVGNHLWDSHWRANLQSVPGTFYCRLTILWLQKNTWDPWCDQNLVKEFKGFFSVPGFEHTSRPLLDTSSPLVLTNTVVVSFLPIMGDTHSMYKLVCHGLSTFTQALLRDLHTIKELVLIKHDRTWVNLLAHASLEGQPNATTPVNSTV